MKYCDNCGGECVELRRNGTKYFRCKNCGSEFDDVVKPAPAPAVTAPTQTTTTAPNGKKVLSGEDIYDKMSNCAVEIFVQNDRSAASASGFFVSSTGFVITNAHAVLDGNGDVFDEVYVKINGKYFSAGVVALGRPINGRDDSLDIALLFVPEAKNISVADLGDSSKLKNGQKVYLIGNSLGEGTCITSGIISDAKRAMPGLSYPYIMTDAAANHGNSGGPLLNEQGEVIGVLVAGIDSAKGMNYAIPINMVKKFINYVVENTDLSRRSLAELSNVKNSPSDMAIGSGVLFSGIRLVLDVVQYIVGLFH